jgi:hypothetical protein
MTAPQEAIAGISTRILQVDPKHIRLLERNARFMRQEVYQRLVANIRRDGKLTSVPFCCKTEDGEWLVLSGNHRVMAAVDAGLDEIDVMVTDDQLTPDQQIAIQLSHNELAGEDDPAILAELYDTIDDVDWREYAALDDKTLELLDTVHVDPLSEANLDYQALTIVFLPPELERAQAAVEDAMAEAKGADVAWAARFEEFDRLLEALDIAGRAHGVKNTAVSLGLILDVFEENVTSLGAAWWDESGERLKRKADWIPHPDDPRLPDALRRCRSDPPGNRPHDRSGGVTHAWQAVELMAADYLAGA